MIIFISYYRGKLEKVILPAVEMYYAKINNNL